jgi:hypothetical protein
MANLNMLLAFLDKQKNKKIEVRTNQEILEGILLETDVNGNIYVELEQGRTVIQRRSWNRITALKEVKKNEKPDER